MITLNDYANSIFQYEFLNDGLLAKCTDYLNNILKGRIKNKVIVDYAFGRGNWSVAFIKAGAKKVYAIDASKDNCDKFQKYCDSNDYKNIEIICGNILEDSYGVKADLIWCYGIMFIFDHINKNKFIHKIKALANNNKSLFYFYEYNSGSLREFVVQSSRKFLKYSSEEEFLKDSFQYIRSARMRVRDDLTAPHVSFFNHSDLQKFYEKHGLYPIQQDVNFHEFLGIKNGEFRPYQFLCALTNFGNIQLREQVSPFGEERAILKIITEEIESKNLEKSLKRKIVIGLNNTYYGYLGKECVIKTCIIELFCFLMYVLVQNNVQISDKKVKQYLELFFESLKGNKREKYNKILGQNIIVKHLVENTVRM